MIGRIKSNNFQLIDGYFYFMNQVLKLRLDLIKRSNLKSKLNEHTVFNKYDNILDLEDNETVQSNSPIICQYNHRMAYFTRNQKNMAPMNMVILPYLHER